MSCPVITLDNHILNDDFTISGIKRWFPAPRMTYDELDGRSGATVTSYAIGTRQVEFTLWAFGSDHSVLRLMLSQVVAWLHSATTHTLAFSDENGLTRSVILDSEPQFDEYEGRASLYIHLLQVDPYLHGETRYYTLSYAGTIRIGIGSTAPPIIRITCNFAERDVDTHVWGVTLGEGLATLHVELPNNAAHSVAIDCNKREVLVDGNVRALSLDSDWPEDYDINPAAGKTAYNKWGDRGMLEVDMDMGVGSEDATIEVVERWM